MVMLKGLLLLFIMFSMGNAEVNLVEKCPYGWTNFGLRCYKYFSQSVNWITAERNCQSIGGNLASIHSKADNDFLLNLMPASSSSYVGAHDGEQEGQWAWTDGSAYDYTNWCGGEPNNAGVENCVEIFSGTSNRCWNDVSCSLARSYICVADL